MSNQVYANMMEVSCKAGSGKTICAFPDVCMTPPQTPATPPGVPIPYPNTGMASDTTDGSSTVKISGKEVMLKNKSYFKKSTGDEAGCAPKKGLLTSKNTGKVYFNAWSMDVKIEGENVVRHLDITTHNHASQPGNSPPMPHTDSMQPAPPEGSACPTSCSSGSPVNPILGAKVLSGDEDLDFTVEGPLPLRWQRFYVSTNNDVGWFGRGWSSPLEVRLDTVPDPSGTQVERIQYVDHFGRRVEFDALEPGSSEFLPGDKVTLSRSADGQYRLTGADGLTRVFEERRDTVHRLAAITDRNGNAIRVDYRDAASGLIDVHSSGGQHLELTVRDGRLNAITEVRTVGEVPARLVLMRYGFTMDSDLAQVVNRAQETLRSFEYTRDRLMCKHVYASVFQAEYEYTGTGSEAKVVRHWDNVGRSWSFEYRDDRTTVIDQDRRRFVYRFDRKRQLIGIIDPLGQVRRLGRDRSGNIRALVDPAGHVTETFFDERGNPVESHAPDGAVTMIEWHPEFPLPLAMIDPLKRTTLFQYDDRGNLVAETDPTGATTRYLYDNRGLVAGTINANGGVSRQVYDDHGQLSLFSDCSGNQTRYTYDGNGWLISATNALDEVTRFDYDDAGRLVRQIRPDGAEERYQNDLAGRLTAFRDPADHITFYQYAPDGLLSRRTDALGHTLLYRYDSSRRLVELVNENQASYSFRYDALNRLIEETRFDGTRVRYGYDPSSRVVESIEQPDSPDAIRFSYTRDPVGRLLVRASDRTRAIFSWDAVGNLVRAHTEDPPVTVDMAYDGADRRVMERVAAGKRTLEVRHAFDQLGNVLQTTLPDGADLTTTYYGCGNAVEISLGGALVTTFERDALHREVGRTQGAVTSTRVYDPGGRLERQRASAVLAGTRGFSEINRQYQYDIAGRLVLALDPRGELTYAYDAVDRLTRFKEERFVFDPAHNMVPPNQADTIVTDNLVRNVNGHSYRYDAHGRVAEKRADGSIVRFTWNNDHRLIASTTIDAAGSHETFYLYDALGRRIAKRGQHGTTWFVWDLDRLLQEYRGENECTYIYEPETYIPLAEALLKGRGAESNARGLLYFHCDQVGVPRELTDSAGNLIWEAEYHGWGRLKTESLAQADVPRPFLRLQGEYCDEETGLHYSLMRYYDPDTGRFVSKDPVGLFGGVNEYWYGPNPVFWIDILGLTGTYIFTDGTKSYVGKGPKERKEASQRARVGGKCNVTAEASADFGDDEMGFMVEHLVMEHYHAQTSSSFLNSANISSPGKKKFEAASPAKKRSARAKAKKIIADFEAAKAECE